MNEICTVAFSDRLFMTYFYRTGLGVIPSWSPGLPTEQFQNVKIFIYFDEIYKLDKVNHVQNRIYLKPLTSTV